jgi:hypothetical protein
MGLEARGGRTLTLEQYRDAWGRARNR